MLFWKRSVFAEFFSYIIIIVKLFLLVAYEAQKQNNKKKIDASKQMKQRKYAEVGS